MKQIHEHLSWVRQGLKKLTQWHLQTSAIVGLIIGIGVLVVSLWFYQKYIRTEPPDVLIFRVERGDVQEAITVRGEVVSAKEFDLEFPFSGIVEKIFVTEGQEVEKGAPLMQLQTKDFELEIRQLQAIRSQNSSYLNKLLAGATNEDIRVLETAVRNAELAIRAKKAAESQTKILLDQAYQNLADSKAKTRQDLDKVYSGVPDTLNMAYLQADDAVHKQTDDLFTNDDYDDPELTFHLADLQVETDVKNLRRNITSTLKSLEALIDSLDITSDAALDKALADTKAKLLIIRNFLEKAMETVNKSVDLSATAISLYKANLTLARSNINASIAEISALQQTIASTKLNNNISINSAQLELNSANAQLKIAEREIALAEGQMKTAKDELAVIKAGSRPEDIAAARAKIEEVDSAIALAREKINKATLKAPTNAKVMKIWLEEGEVFKPSGGLTETGEGGALAAISLSATGHKVQADVSELDIRKVRDVDGNEVLIRLDAFPGQSFQGQVMSIEPLEVTKDEDRYFRINVSIETHGDLIRPGMSADLIIYTDSKKGVLKIPEFAVNVRDNKKFVTVLEGKETIEVEIKTGLSDGEYIEVVSGLKEGQVLALSAD